MSSDRVKTDHNRRIQFWGTNKDGNITVLAWHPKRGLQNVDDAP